MSATVLVVLMGVGALSTVWVRGIVRDQEQRLLQERGSAAGLVITSSIGNVDALMGQLATAARVSASTPAAFSDVAAAQMSASPALRALALLKASAEAFVVELAAGPGLAPGQVVSGQRATAATSATQGAKLVSTSVFRDGPDLVIGFAIGPPTAPPGSVVYRESRIVPGSPTRSTQSAPFAELNAELYAAPHADPGQLVLATAERPAPGASTFHLTVPVGDSKWLLIISAKHPLVGTLVSRLPWIVALLAFAGSLLVAGALDALLRRRDYAFALVHRRTSELRESLASLELARKEAALARDQALEASKMKSQFLANMSHEIRTPLNGVIGMTGLLLDTALEGEQLEFAETARRSGEALLDLINDILDFSKIEAGKLELETSPFDLGEMVEDVADLFAPAAQQKGLEVTTSIASDLPALVSGDPGRVRQVLTNLVGNAIKFTEFGEVCLGVTVEADADPPAVRCAVRDTGMGIEESQQQRLFESFTQADASTTRRYGGTGLGLAISKRLTEMMGGTLGVQSQPGAGSTFWFTIPLRPMERDGPLEADSSDLAGLRVLIVDDNPTNRTILERQLAARSIQTAVAPDGPSALDALRGHGSADAKFDVVLLDWDMPKMGGLDVVAAVAGDPSLDSVRLVMLTSVGTARNAHPRLSATVTKPVRRSQLFRTIASVTGAGAWLPLQDSAAEPSESRAPIARGLRALVAEDHPVNQRVVSAMLSRLGFRVDVAGDGAEAVAAVTQLPYDVVFMDCQMPRMNGYDAARQIREREAPDRHVPIVALTAAAMKGDAERCLAAGMDLAKPVKAEQLAWVLGSVLGSTPGAPTTPPPQSQGEGAADLDEETLERIRTLGGDVLDSISADFRRTAPVDLDLLKSGLAASDPEAVLSAAHRLKGACLVVGASRMSAAVAEIESQAENGQYDLARTLVPDLERSFEAVLVSLRARV